MKRETEKLLIDIQIALRDLEDFTAGVDLAGYRADAMRRAAVERKFEIVGEACNGLKAEDSGTFDRISYAVQIIGFRNRLIHGYDSVDDAIVWDVIQTRLPLLKAEVGDLLASDG